MNSVLIATGDAEQALAWAQVLRDTGQWHVLDAAHNFGRACRALEQHRPDLLAADLRLPGGHALDLVRLLRTGLRPMATQILIVVRESDDARLLDALQEGADNFVSAETVTPQSLPQHACDTLAGGAELAPAIAQRLLDHFGLGEMPKGRPRVEDLTNPLLLTDIEHRLLCQLSAGWRVADVARVEGVRPRDLMARLRAIYRKVQWEMRAGDLTLQGG